MRRLSAIVLGAMLLLTSAAAVSPGAAQAGGSGQDGRDPLAGIDHIVVIYEENHSFDNLWGLWPGVDGLARQPARTPRQTQVDRSGQPFDCLLQDDVNLTTSADPPPNGGLEPSCSTNPPAAFNSHFPNQVFDIGKFITPQSTTCFHVTPTAPFGPANGVPNGSGEPGGCTRDLVHRFYQEQYQIDQGRMDRYTVGSDAVGLTQGYYDTSALPLFRFLTGDRHAPGYVIADRFFQSAFGGSFLNHQWLIAAQTPQWQGAVHDGGLTDLHSIVGSDGHPNNTYPLHSGPVFPAAGGVKDGALTEFADPATGACAPPAGSPAPPPGTVCGDFAVNTIQPTFQPFQPGTAATRQLPPSHDRTIGDLLSAKGVSWNWYAGGWDNAAGITDGPGWTNGSGPSCSQPDTWAGASFPFCPNLLFQFHHQPFNYFANYGPEAPGRSHLRDEQDFIADLKGGRLPAVSFVKPIGQDNEHPGYTNVTAGDQHLVELIKAIQADKRDWPSTAIVVTYDEFGGSWDHLPPPTAPGVSDVWGPGTRIPAMVLSDRLPQRAAVDHTQYDTVSILSMLEDRFGLPALSSRDAADHSLGLAFRRGLRDL
jgi:acid phosphatase